MSFVRAAAAVAFWLGVTAVPAGAQPETSSNCKDDRGVDRCSAAQHRRVLDLFGMKPIGEHASAGDQVRRIFYVDGYGRDVVAIAFVRAPGRDPTLFVQFPKPERGAPRAPLTALIPLVSWEAALLRSSHFERDLVVSRPPPSTKDETITLCIHSWVYTVEATDPPDREGGEVRTRQKVEDACEDGLAEVFARELAALALPLLPYCNALDPDLHRNDASRLGACWSLEGDRLAAASAHNLALRLARLDRPEDGDGASELFEYDAKLTWAEPGAPGRRAAQNWIERTTGAARARFYFSRVVGESRDRARIEGELIRTAGDDDHPIYLHAPVTLMVSGIDERRAQIERGTIGAFARIND